MEKEGHHMSDDDQTTTPPEVDQSAEQAANEALANTAVTQDLNAIEYATPSAYIDPDLPAYNPDAQEEEPEEPEETEDQEGFEMTPEQIEEAIKASHAVMAKVAEKIANSRNILIALSSDPSVDELSAAITLSLFLDRLGKHAIAIYSGATPNALEFLKPGETFEPNADVLQDFVIALDKDKADHLRYKLDGEYIKVFITPYNDRITAEDLEFSYGDYNVDLVLSLNVHTALDLDNSLREYGRIMHDATVVNITTGNPGKFGEIEWSNKRASSVSEMIADLLCNASGDIKLNPEEATALLTGIVASTDRFAHSNTFSTTMQIASQLIDSGADPQLVAENITEDVDNQFFTFTDLKAKQDAEAKKKDDLSYSFEPTEEPKKKDDDKTALQISHNGDDKDDDDSEGDAAEFDADIHGEEKEEEPEEKEEKKDEPKEEPKVEEPKEEPKEEEKEETKEEEKPEEDSALLDELKATAASLSNVGAETAPTAEPAPVAIDNAPAAEAPAPEAPATPEIPPVDLSLADVPPVETPAPVTPPSLPTVSDPSKYGQMLADALSEPAAGAGAPMESALPPAAPNPAADLAPNVNAPAEVNNMPEINYGQTANDPLLPPPPTPPVDMNFPMPLPDQGGAPTPPAAGSADATPPAPDAFTIPSV